MPTHNFKVTTNGNPIVELNELRKHLITWAQNQATGYRVQASVGKTKHNYDTMTAKADGFDFMVKYLQGMEIKEG